MHNPKQDKTTRTYQTTDRFSEELTRTLIRYAGSFSPVLIERAKGSFVYTTEGQAILDFTSGQMCAIMGHSHPAMVEALEKASRECIHLLSTMLSPAVVACSQELIKLLPQGLDKAMLINTGAESNEVAIRMSKLHTGGFEMLGFTGSWHGMTAGAQTSTYAGTRHGYGPVMPGAHALPAPYAYRCPIKHCKGTCDHTCLEVGMELFDKQSVGAPAAVIIEPILSAAGIVELPEGYMAKLKQFCEDRGMLLILDEAQTGLGRLGSNFAFEQEGIIPDFLTLSKTLGGGLPLAATITSKEIEESCHEKGFIYVTSHVSDPLPATLGVAMLRVLVEENLAQRAGEMGAYLKDRFLELQQVHECIGDVRGKGLLLGIEIVSDRENKTPDPDFGHQIMDRCLELGLNMNIVRVKGMGGVFRIAPPLTVSKEELDLGVSILDQAIKDCYVNKRS